jgi:glycosyltransferase involved in cell wall biosynthesis
LAELITDFWVPPGSLFAKLPGGQSLCDRFHSDLGAAKVFAPNLRMLAFEAKTRLQKPKTWEATLQRNTLFQHQAISSLETMITDHSGLGTSPTLFSYSYAALDLFRFAKERGWQTVLGQIDPGPEEERIVVEEQRRYPQLGSRWQPAPPSYWDAWREELELADRIIVNSEWSRDCLRKEGVPEGKMEVVPLVYQAAGQQRQISRVSPSKTRVLFLGQILLRKGIGRLLEAMRMLNLKLRVRHVEFPLFMGVSWIFGCRLLSTCGDCLEGDAEQVEGF